MKKFQKFLITILALTGLGSLGLWIAIVTELAKYIVTWKIITLFLAPLFFIFQIWALFRLFKTVKKHVDRVELEKDHLQKIRHENEKELIKAGKIPSHINFRLDPTLISTQESQLLDVDSDEPKRLKMTKKMKKKRAFLSKNG